MFTKYIKGLSKHDDLVVLSITNATRSTKAETIIQRNNVREHNDIYVRARDIYFRARRQRPVKAASIF